jgi:hypothetical protein
MFKKMKYLIMIALVILGATTISTAQEDDSSYNMWESIMITPDYTQLKVFGENMRAHNLKYHAQGSQHQGAVYNINTGPNTGKILWQMGPITWASLDSRPAAGGHDEDWRDNIMPYVKKMESSEYWKEMSDLSNVAMLAGNIDKYPIFYVRYFEVEKGQGYAIANLLKQMSAAVKAMDGENPWGLYDNEMRQGYTTGRHIAWVGFMENYAAMDDDGNFKEAFIKTHGEGSWQPYLKGMDDTFSNSWDEMWSYNKELSGH